MYFGAALTGVGVDDLLARDPDAAAAAPRATRPARRRERCSRSSEAERREDRLRAHVLRDAADARSRPARRRRSDVETVTAIEVFDRRHDAAASGGPRRRDRQGPRALDAHASATRFGPTARTGRPARVRPADAGDGDRAPAPGARSGPCSTRSPSSPSRIRSSTSARTTPATSCSCRSTARSRRRSSPRRWRATTASTSSSARRRRSASSDRTASAQPSNCSRAAGRRPTRSSPRSAWRSRPCRPDSGVTFELDVSVKSIPIHVFDSVDAFRQRHAAHRPRHAAPGPPRLGRSPTAGWS